MTSPGVEIAEQPPEFIGCPVCGRRLVLVNGVQRHLEDWLAARPQDND